MSADPVRVFRQHYGDDAFDLIPDQEAFGMGPTGYGPTTNERVSVLEKVIKEPIMKKGPDNPGGYLTKGEYQAKIDHQDEVLGYIERGEGRFGDLEPQEIAAAIAHLNVTFRWGGSGAAGGLICIPKCKFLIPTSKQPMLPLPEWESMPLASTAHWARWRCRSPSRN